MRKKPTIMVLSSPSGGGKTTLARLLRKEIKELTYSVSTTTRPMRKGERNGIDYTFVSEKEFKKMIKKGEFVEWALVHGHYYGTPVKNIKDALKKGKDILLDLDVKGAKNLKKIFPEAILVFITVKSLKELKRRLILRRKDDLKTIEMRLRNARKELKEIKRFDYLIINDNLKKAKAQLKAIYIASKLRIPKEEKCQKKTLRNT